MQFNDLSDVVTRVAKASRAVQSTTPGDVAVATKDSEY